MMSSLNVDESNTDSLKVEGKILASKRPKGGFLLFCRSIMSYVVAV